MLLQQQLLATTCECEESLNYIDMFHSPACWKTRPVGHAKFNKLGSETTKEDAVKMQIQPRVGDFVGKTFDIPFPKRGKTYSS